MPTPHDETVDHDLATILQLVTRAVAALDLARDGDTHYDRRARLHLYPREEADLRATLQAIKNHTNDAREKLLLLTLPAVLGSVATTLRSNSSPLVDAMPDEYLVGAGGPNKLLRFYWCMDCGHNHWEDTRVVYDDHIIHAGRIQYGHRPVAELVP